LYSGFLLLSSRFFFAYSGQSFELLACLELGPQLMQQGLLRVLQFSVACLSLAQVAHLSPELHPALMWPYF
jgi:hypothetical protein